MSYVAIQGGAQAINNSTRLFNFLRAHQAEHSLPLDTDDIQHQLRLLHSRVISEGGIYHPELAALALKQFQGDTLESAFALRAYRSTCPRLLETPCHDTQQMRVTRRISAAFKDIAGGQSLGACTDYQLRLLDMTLIDESGEGFAEAMQAWLSQIDGLSLTAVPDSFPKVLDELRDQGLLPPRQPATTPAFDITREPLVFPVTRSAALATMTRAEQGSLLAMAYSNMRGYGDIHPTVAELRVGYVPVMIPHPITGELCEAGEVEVTECEVVAMYEQSDEASPADTGQTNTTASSLPTFTLGYGACFGHNEVKAISMAILDRALQNGQTHGVQNPSEDPEFVLLHIDGVDSMGFCSHYKMPHYVTFQSDMDRLRQTQQKQSASGSATQSTEGAS